MSGDDVPFDPRYPLARDYVIVPTPCLSTVTPGAVVQYRCRYQGELGPPRGSRRATAIGALNAIKFRFTWYKFKHPSIGPGGDGAWLDIDRHDDNAWTFTWAEPPGRYIVACSIHDPTSETTRWCFLAQHVIPVDVALTSAFLATREGASHPDEALGSVERLMDLCRKLEEKCPSQDPTLKQRSEVELRALEEFRDTLAVRLASTKGLTREPIRAAYFDTRNQRTIQLNVFLARVESHPQVPSPRVVGPPIPARQVWRLVDWTFPMVPALSPEVDAEGETDEKAIGALIEAWSHRNRYTEGRIMVEVQVGDVRLRRTFDTTGYTTLDNVTWCLSTVATVGAFVVWLGTAVASCGTSVVASTLIWSTVAASTAAATISIYQRHEQGFGTLKDDGFDALTILGNLLAVGAGWTRGATLIRADPGGKATQYLLFGRLANDVVQGILVAREQVTEYDRIMADPTLTPRERLRHLLAWIGNVGLTGLMLGVSIRGSLHDLEPRHLRPGGVPEVDPQLLRSPAQKLRSLLDPGETITLVETCPVEGNAPDAERPGRNTQHRTTAHIDAEMTPPVGPPGAPAVLRPVDAPLLGRPVPLDEALVQKLPGWETRNRPEYGRQMAAAVEELKGRIRSGEITTAREAILFMGRKAGEVAAAIGRTDLARGQTLADFGELRSKKSQTLFTDERSPYHDEYCDRAQELAETSPSGKFLRIEDGIPLTETNLAMWDHTNPRDFNAIWLKLEVAWKRAIAAESPKDVVDAVAELHWWAAHMMPFKRGSAGAVDGVTKAVLGARGIEAGAWRVGKAADIEAFLRTKADFVGHYGDFFEK